MEQNTNQNYQNQNTQTQNYQAPNYQTQNYQTSNYQTQNYYNYQAQRVNNDESKNKVMAVVGYIGIFGLIPYFSEKNNEFVRFHAVQGLNLWIVTLILTFALTLIGTFSLIIPYLGIIIALLLSLVLFAIGIFSFVLQIMGIVYACQGKIKELPLISKIKIIK